MQFTSAAFDYADAANLHPDLVGFQLALHQPYNNDHRIFFPPYGPEAQPLGRLLAYDPRGDFHSPSSYQHQDLRTLVDTAAQGWIGGFLDDAGWLYLTPYRKNVGAGTVPNGLAVRHQTQMPMTSAGAYEKFDVTALGMPLVGWVQGAFDPITRKAFFVPASQQAVSPPVHGNLLRYDATGPFTSIASWSYFDLTTLTPFAAGFQSSAVYGNRLFLVPDAYSRIVVYDLTMGFTDPAAYTAQNLLTFHPEGRGFVGAEVIGHFLYLVPYRDRSEPSPPLSMQYTAARYDLEKPITSASSWEWFDMQQVDPRCGGYQYSFNDGTFWYLVPFFNFATNFFPPYIRYDMRKPFTSVSAWAYVENPTGPVSTGGPAQYAGYGYMAPYGGAGDKGTITRVRTAGQGVLT